MSKAIIRFNFKRPIMFISQEKGLHIFDVLTGKVEPENEQQAAFIETVERVYLDRKLAPQSYLDMYPIGEPSKPKQSSWFEPSM